MKPAALTLLLLLSFPAAAQITTTGPRTSSARGYTAQPVALGALGSCAALAGTYASVDASPDEPYYCDGVDWSPIVTSKTLPENAKAALLGEPLSARTLVLTNNESGTDTLSLLGGRLRLVPYEVNGNGYLTWNPNIGLSTPAALEIGAGSSFFADSLYSRQGDRSVSLDQAQGLRLAPQSSIGTCDNTTGSGHHREGDVKTLSGASLSARTRICMCSSDGGGTPAYAWLNVTTGTVGTSTACNN